MLCHDGITHLSSRFRNSSDGEIKNNDTENISPFDTVLSTECLEVRGKLNA